MGDPIYLVAFGALSIGFPILLLVSSKLLAPSKPNPVKLSTYECGEVPVGIGHPRFVVQYFAYAIIFTIFDVLVTFLLVFSPLYGHLSGLLGMDFLAPMFVFVVVLTVGLAYIVSAISIR